MLKNTKNTLAAYVAGTAALAGSAAHGAVVYQAIGLTFTDISTTDLNTVQTLAAVRFDGTSITVTGSSSGGALSLSADDDYVLSGSAKHLDGGRTASGGYTMSTALLTAGQTLAPGFTSSTALQTFTGAATDQYVGVSTPTGQLGWVRFSYANDGVTLTVQDAAFQSTPGDSIIVGSTVPEPASLALAGLAGGMAMLRRRRTTAAV